MGKERKDLKGLGLALLALVLLSPLAISGDSEALNNETNQTNATSVNASATIAGASCPAIVPPGDRPGGLTYGEWNAEWWKWAYSMPVDKHPLFDTADCSEGQSGDVWFLGSNFTSEITGPNEFTAKVDRKCTIPPEKMLFFPVMNVEGSRLEGNGKSEKQLRDYAGWVMAHAIEMSAEIDGCPVENLEGYRASSPLFTFGPLPENNVLQSLGFDAPAGTESRAVADGIYLMLEPLSLGAHTIHFKGTFKFSQDLDGFDFVFKQDVNYKIIVKPNWRPPRMFMPKNS